jgi:O-antigen/teichoic acid export membrane protein
MWRSIRSLLLRRTSVRLNLSANLTSKILAAVVSLACVPIFIHVLDVAGYGVIGFWLTLETLASVMDLGIGPTMTRELASTAGRPGQAQPVRDLVRTIELLYWLPGLLIGAAIVLGAPLIATHWLRSTQISPGELSRALQLIGVLILCRWPISFYSSSLSGLERQVLLAWIGLIFAVIRNVGAVAVLIFVSPTIVAFLLWQIAINLLNTAVLMVSLWRHLPAGNAPRFDSKSLFRVWKFAGGVTAITLVTLLLTDLDKIVVSRLVSLTDFGYYALAARMATTLTVASSSVFAAVYPALARLVSEHDEAGVAALYHRGAQTVSVLIFPAALTAALFAWPLILAWTGDTSIADHSASIAALLVMGTAFYSIGYLAYLAQLAHGWTSLAFWTNLAYVPVTAALLIGLTMRFGGIGAASAWLLVTLSYFVINVPLMHRRILKGQAWRWYIEDVGVPFAACAVTAVLLAATLGPATTRLGAAFMVIVAGILIGAAGLLAAPFVRNDLRETWLRYSGQWRREKL